MFAQSCCLLTRRCPLLHFLQKNCHLLTHRIVLGPGFCLAKSNITWSFRVGNFLGEECQLSILPLYALFSFVQLSFESRLLPITLNRLNLSLHWTFHGSNCEREWRQFEFSPRTCQIRVYVCNWRSRHWTCLDGCPFRPEQTASLCNHCCFLLTPLTLMSWCWVSSGSNTTHKVSPLIDVCLCVLARWRP